MLKSCAKLWHEYQKGSQAVLALADIFWPDCGRAEGKCQTQTLRELFDRPVQARGSGRSGGGGHARGPSTYYILSLFARVETHIFNNVFSQIQIFVLVSSSNCFFKNSVVSSLKFLLNGDLDIISLKSLEFRTRALDISGKIDELLY